MAKKATKRPGIGHNGGPRVRHARAGNLYKTYRFKDTDPVIEVLRLAKDDSKARVKTIHDNSGVASGTIYRWFSGKTRKPQFATVVAVARSIGAVDAVEALIRRGR